MAQIGISGQSRQQVASRRRSRQRWSLPIASANPRADLVFQEIHSILLAADEVVSTAQKEHYHGGVTAPTRETLHLMCGDIGIRLAHFEDGGGYGQVPFDMIAALRRYEEIGSSLLAMQAAA